MKTCVVCGRDFTPKYNALQVACSITCAKRHAKRERVKKNDARKAELETIPELLKEAQREFNLFCRERDKASNRTCVSCGSVLDWGGNRVDAGHWRSVGAAAHLRFNEGNCHAQCKHCNRFLSGNAVAYRAGLIKRIGLEAVESLESDNTIRKWTREELRAIRDTYRAKAKQLRNQG